MTGIELTRFDQTAVLLSLICGFSLVRERRVLPFLMVLVGAFFHGPVIPCFVAAMVVWHRMGAGCGKWIQIKDFAGVFFILSGAIAPDPVRAFFSVFGVILIAANFGGSALGTLPAILFLRQYHPNPEYLEVALVGHASYWILVEVSRWTEIPGEHRVLSWAEVLATLLILSSFKDEIGIMIANPELTIAGGFLFASLFSTTLWGLLRPEGFFGFFQRLRPRLESFIFWGGRLVSGDEPWARRESVTVAPDINSGIKEVFWWIMGLVITSVLSGLLLHGGEF
ncbi:MAG: hypothetical protein KGP28_02055 [Bdellovibrionales bacterium]|nr:hypothetical protein [Bdellovibrionales bacterium]